MGAPPPAAWPLPVAWLHPPKTGSTFGLTVYRHACSDIPANATVGCLPPIAGLTRRFPVAKHCAGGFTSARRVDLHPPSNPHEDHGRLLAMLRAPAAQKASLLSFVLKLATDAEYDRRCSVVCEAPMTTSGLPPAVAREACAAARAGRLQHLMELVLPPMRGCQAKMLHGTPCLRRSNASELDRLQPLTATRVPSAFAFVGVTERWAESVCLFHFLREGGIRPVAAEFVNSRPTSTRARSLSLELWRGIAANRSDLMGWLLDDVYDGLLYARAARHFAAALAKARNRSTWVPTCVANHRTFS